LKKASIITAVVVMALLMTACGDDDEAATTEAAATSIAAPAQTTTIGPEEATTTSAAPADATTTTAVPADTTTTAAVAAPAVAVDGMIDIMLVSFEFSPVSWVVTSGEPIVINVINMENSSSEPHTWTLLAAGTVWTTWRDFDLEQILATTQGVPANSMATLEFTAPEPGTYQVVCTVRGHIQRGMVGELVVEG